MDIYAWKLLEWRGRYLTSPVRGTIWPPDQYLKAENFPTLQKGESPRGGPGIHAVTEEAFDELGSYAGYDNIVLVKIKCAGRVYILDNGIVLTEKAKPVEIYVLDSEFEKSSAAIQELKSLYGVEVHVFGEQRIPYRFSNGVVLYKIISDMPAHNYIRSYTHIAELSDQKMKFYIDSDSITVVYSDYEDPNINAEILKAVGTYLFMYRGWAIDLAQDTKIFCKYDLSENGIEYPIGGQLYGVHNPVGITDYTSKYVLALLDSDLTLINLLTFRIDNAEVEDFQILWKPDSTDLGVIREYFSSKGAYFDTWESNYRIEYIDAPGGDISIQDLDDFMELSAKDLQRAVDSEDDVIDTDTKHEIDEYGILTAVETINYVAEPVQLYFTYDAFLNIVEEASYLPEPDLYDFLDHCRDILTFIDLNLENINMKYPLRDWMEALDNRWEILRSHVKQILDYNGRGDIDISGLKIKP
ncbi:MAG: hypothetical protein QXU32_01520 [Nitrososphaerales archaeon]